LLHHLRRALMHEFAAQTGNAVVQPLVAQRPLALSGALVSQCRKVRSIDARPRGFSMIWPSSNLAKSVTPKSTRTHWLTEPAWCYRFKPRIGAQAQRRQECLHESTRDGRKGPSTPDASRRNAAARRHHDLRLRIREPMVGAGAQERSFGAAGLSSIAPCEP
jgi:hypothetical protein